MRFAVCDDKQSHFIFIDPAIFGKHFTDILLLLFLHIEEPSLV